MKKSLSTLSLMLVLSSAAQAKMICAVNAPGSSADSYDQLITTKELESSEQPQELFKKNGETYYVSDQGEAGYATILVAKPEQKAFRSMALGNGSTIVLLDRQNDLSIGCVRTK